jgi:hypothetical protein
VAHCSGVGSNSCCYDNNNALPATPKLPSLDARALLEFLIEIGASSVSVTNSNRGTPSEDPIFGSAQHLLDDNDKQLKLPLRSKYAMVLLDLSISCNLWRRCNLSVHFPHLFNPLYIVDAVRNAFNCSEGADNGGDVSADGNHCTALSYAVKDVPNLDWMTHVQMFKCLFIKLSSSIPNL